MNNNLVVQKEPELIKKSDVLFSDAEYQNHIAQPKPKCFFQDSEFYQIRGGFIAEVINNPALKGIKQGVVSEMIVELTKVTLSSFGKTEDQKETYASEKIIRKNAILVDWLTVVRFGSSIVAYAASSYLDDQKQNLYFNATIVDQAYQSKGGLGSINHMFILEKILKERMDFESNTLDLITRTRNKNVARLMDSVLNGMKISTDDNLALSEKKRFANLADLIGGSYDATTGIDKNVYPVGLPSGAEKSDEINKSFECLGECDGVLISGKINYQRICKFLKREVVSIATNNTETNLGLIAA
jgi:hypothetical protein